MTNSFHAKLAVVFRNFIVSVFVIVSSKGSASGWWHRFAASHEI